LIQAREFHFEKFGKPIIGITFLLWFTALIRFACEYDLIIVKVPNMSQNNKSSNERTNHAGPEPSQASRLDLKDVPKSQYNESKQRRKTFFGLIENNKVDQLQEYIAKRPYSVNFVDPDDNHTPLHKAVLQGNSSIVDILINTNVSLNSLDRAGETPLHLACLKGHQTIVDALLKAGAQVNLKDRHGRTPLHNAVLADKAAIVVSLVQHKAHLTPDKRGNSPLHIAAEKGHSEVLNLLLSMKSATKRIFDGNVGKKFTPLHLAAAKGHTTCVVLLLQKMKPKIDVTDHHGMTPLHHAAIQGHFDVAEKLLEATANVDARDRTQMTPMHYAAKKGHVLLLKLLIEKKGDVNALNVKKMSPLHFAAKYGHIEVASLLIEHGAKVDTEDAKGWQSIDYACKFRHIALAEFLAKSGADIERLYDYKRHRIKSKTFYNVDAYGFILQDDSNSAMQPENTVEVYRTKEQEKWQRTINKLVPSSRSSRRKIRKKLYKGIPNQFRGTLWLKCCGAQESRDENPHEYNRLLNASLERIHADQIDKDINRTMRGHIKYTTRFGKGQCMLYNVLKAYAIRDPEVGYCQGMSEIAALLLLYLDEELAFWTLVRLFENYEIRTIYTPTMDGLHTALAVFESIMRKFAPDISEHLRTNNVSVRSFATRWFVTLFHANLPWPILLRFFDLFFLDGYVVVYKCALAYLTLIKDELFAATSQEELLKVLLNRSLTNGFEMNGFFKVVRRYKVTQKLTKEMEAQLPSKKRKAIREE
jgi:ankyrin repeat protein